MDRNELDLKLKKLGVPNSYYSLEGKLLLGYVLERHSFSVWKVFEFDERGNKRHEMDFDTEEKACEYMYELILPIAKYFYDKGEKFR